MGMEVNGWRSKVSEFEERFGPTGNQETGEALCDEITMCNGLASLTSCHGVCMGVRYYPLLTRACFWIRCACA